MKKSNLHKKLRLSKETVSHIKGGFITVVGNPRTVVTGQTGNTCLCMTYDPPCDSNRTHCEPVQFTNKAVNK